MSNYVDELQEIVRQHDRHPWDAPGVARLRVALDTLSASMQAIAARPGWEGESAEAAQAYFVELADRFDAAADALRASERVVRLANRHVEEAKTALGNLPSGNIHNFLQSGVDGLEGAAKLFLDDRAVDYAGDSAVNVVSSILGDNREAAAKRALDKLQDSLEFDGVLLGRVEGQFKPALDGTTGGSRFPEDWPPTEPERGTDDNTSEWQTSGYSSGGSGGSGSGSGNDSDRSGRDDDGGDVDYDFPELPPAGPLPEGPNIKLGSGGGSGGSGGSGAGAGFGAAALGGGAAAGAAALRMGRGGLGAGATGAPSGTGGLLGGNSTGSPGAGGMAGRGSGGAMMGAPMGGGARGGSKKQQPGSGLSGLMAPKFEADDEAAPMSDAARAGGRDERKDEQ